MSEDTLGVAETPPLEDAESSIEDSSPQETVAEPESPPETDEPKRSRASERITGLIGDNKALREYGEHMRAEVARLSEQQTPAIPQETVLPRPKIEDFDHDQDKWAEAFSDWSVKEASKVAQAQVTETLRQQTAADEQAEMQAAWQDKSAEFAEKNPDFHAVISNPALSISKDMAALFMETDTGPAIAYHLGKNPDKAAKISRMNPRRMALAIGRLETEVSSPKPQSTNAPQPPNPVGGQQPNVDPTKMSTDDWVAPRREELHAKGRR